MLRHRWQNNMPDCRSRHDRASALWVSRCDRMSDGSAVAGWNQLAPPHPPDAALPLAHGRNLGSLFGSSAKGFLAILIASGIPTRRGRGPVQIQVSDLRSLACLLPRPPPLRATQSHVARIIARAPSKTAAFTRSSAGRRRVAPAGGTIGPLTRPSTFAGRWCNLAVRCGWRRKVLSPSRNCAAAAPGGAAFSPARLGGSEVRPHVIAAELAAPQRPQERLRNFFAAAEQSRGGTPLSADRREEAH